MRAILLTLLLVSGQVVAEPTTVGAGNLSCGQILEIKEVGELEVSDGIIQFGLEETFEKLHKAAALAAYMVPYSWVQGYVSAQSQHTNLATTDSAAVTKYLENYCEENPLDTLQDATDSLVAELAERAE